MELDRLVLQEVAETCGIELILSSIINRSKLWYGSYY